MGPFCKKKSTTFGSFASMLATRVILVHLFTVVMMMTVIVWVRLDHGAYGSSSSYQDSVPKCPTPFSSCPCFCSKTSLQSPVDVFCVEGNLASIALPIKNYFASLPVRNLTIRGGHFSRLSGPLLNGLDTVSSLSLESCEIESLARDVLYPVTPSLRILSFKSNKLMSIPSESMTRLNLTHLDVSNNRIISLSAGSFPKDLSSLVSLNISNNLISRTEAASFQPFASSLEELDMSHNQVTKLERNVFKGMKKLRILDLSFNNFSTFDRSDFVELLGLQVIRLAGLSRLKKLPQSIFARNSQLHTIDLSFDSFEEVDPYVTRGVRFLRKFLASGNKISLIAKRAFSTNTRLRAIELSRNSLTSVPADTFSGLQYLEWLDLSFNSIQTLDPGSFQSISRIGINLSHNKLNFIPRSAFVDVANIYFLDLSYNNLTRIHDEAFLDSDVTHLMLEHNKFSNLSFVPIGNFSSISFLNLSHNEIERVDRKSFGLKPNTKLYEAAVIDLSFNRLKDMSGSMFERFWALRHLNLSHNQLKRLGFGSFGNLPTLLNLDLDHNQLKEVNSIHGLISLKTLTVRNNKLKTLPTLPVALNHLNVESNEIDSISCSSFPAINSLLSLDARSNLISSLDPDSFCNLLTLRSLDLSFNNVSDVEQISASLNKLSSLQSLNLSFNSIPSIDSSTAFGNMPTLFTLDLAGNSISQVSPFAFNGLLQLLSLNLSRNRMMTIEPDSLKGLVSLQSLDLSYNFLSRIENRTNSFFEDLLSLEWLNLAGNRLSFLTSKSLPSSQWVPHKMRFLDLSFNHLESVSTAVGFTHIQDLLLHHNHIRTVIPGVFGNMSSLRSLDLSHNRITHIPLHGFSLNLSSPKDALTPTIQLLNLSFNQIESVDAGEFTRISVSSISSAGRTHSSPSQASQSDNNGSVDNLRSLDLSHNKLTTHSWPEEDVSVLVGRGVAVNMTDNPLPCTCGSRLQVDAVRRSVQRISPRLSQMLTFNHDVNTYDSQDNNVRIMSLTASSTSPLVMNEAQVEWDSLTCPVQSLQMRRSPPKKRNRRPKNKRDSVSLSNTTDESSPITTTQVPEVTSNAPLVVLQEPKNPLLTQLSSQELSCSDQEALSLLEGDVLIRGLSWFRGSRNALRVVWFVRNELEDIANFRVERSEVDPDPDSTSESLEVSYSEREYVFEPVNPKKQHKVCLRTFDSSGQARPMFPSSCLTSSIKPK